MRRPTRIIIYFFLGFLIFSIMDDDEALIPSSQQDWMIPLLAVVLVVLLGFLYFRKNRKN